MQIRIMCADDDLEVQSAFIKRPSKGLQALIKAPSDCSQCQDRAAAETLLSMGQHSVGHNCAEVQQLLLPPSSHLSRISTPVINYEILTPPPSDSGCISDDSCDMDNSSHLSIPRTMLPIKKQSRFNVEEKPTSVLAQVCTLLYQYFYLLT